MKLLVLDGNSILNRAFYGIKLLTTKDGQYTNAIYGFMTTFQKLLEESQPNAVAIAFDLKAPTFRHKAYDGYKATRKGMPEELASQLEPLKELLTALGYKIVTCEGYEADDILGTLAAECTSKGYECMIATGDRDSLQLVSPTVTVRIAATKMGKPDVTLYDEDKIKEVYGVAPPQLIDIKAIQGDTSDCIPGVAGIGEKGAKDLIARFGNLDYIYENIDTIDVKKGVRQKLIDGKEMAYKSRMLGTIVKDVPIDKDISHYVRTVGDAEKAKRIMAKLELFSLMKKMDFSEDVKTEQADIKSVEYAEFDSLEKLYEHLKNKTVDFVYFNDISIYDGEKVYIVPSLMPDFREFMQNFFKDDTIKKRTHNAKAVFAELDEMGTDCHSIIFDTSLAAYLLNPDRKDYSLDRLLQEYNISAYECERECPVLKLTPVADVLAKEIEDKKQSALLNDIEIPLSKVLASMENIGFAVDKNAIQEYGIRLQKEIDELQKSIYSHVGYEFNINSPKQLAEALFEKLGLPAKKKTKSGYSTNADVLEELKIYHPVINEILEYRTVAKLKSTYCDGLIKVIDSDGRIHSSFNQTETRTGRISSTEPNLQNIPVRTQRGREFRKFFTAKDGYVLVDADYSQIELRVLAHVADDENMINAFKNNLDIHTSTASKVFNMPADFVTPDMRSKAKAVNFGIVYGIGAFSLSKDINVSVKEADKYIKEYLSHYSGIDRYLKSVVEQAKNDGYAKTMFGRIRKIPELTSSNHNLRAFGERVAKNMPIQGTAADIIKIAMIKVDERLKKEGLKARLILQVHDELIVEAPESEALQAAQILSEEMQNAVKLKVPLPADSGIGKTWYDAKK